jgi:hypothetical protein
MQAELIELIKRFLLARKTGQLILNVKDGAVLVVEIKESVRLEVK